MTQTKITILLLINFSMLQTLRGNQAPFLPKDLRKEIYTRSKLKNKYNRSPTEQNKAIYKKTKK